MVDVFLSSMRDFAGFCWSIFSYLGQLASVTVGDYLQNGFSGVGTNPFTSYTFDGLGSAPPADWLFNIIHSIEEAMGITVTDSTVFVFSLYVVAAGFVLLVIARALTSILGAFTPNE